jgi:hypothetical protein
MDVAHAYANGRADLDDVAALDDSRRCYNGPNWIKVLMAMLNPPRVVLRFPSPLLDLDKDVIHFLDRFI